MPIRTRARERLDRQPSRAELLNALPRLLAGAAGFAAAELMLGIILGGFFALGRAEALLFLAFRPWLLLIAAVLVARRPWRERAGFYALALCVAALAESLLLMELGAKAPWPEAARGIAAGALVVLLADAGLQLGYRFRGKVGRWLAAGLLAMIWLIPAARAPYEAIVLGQGRGSAAEKRDLMMLSALPLMWGELGPLDSGSRPASAFRLLEQEFRVRPLDVLDGPSLSGGKLLLLAQPRVLAPAELVALDDWVRAGGRVMILTDPMLLWPSELPLGDIRRPPAIGLLGPLLQHWGLQLEPPAEPKPVVEEIETGGEERRMALLAPGRFKSSGACTVRAQGLIAHCAVGKGRAILIADADMLHDRLWAGPGSIGTERHGRLSDNPLIVADLLDRLAGSPRPRIEQPVEWRDRGADPARALLLALLPLAFAVGPAAWTRLRGDR